MVSWDGQFAIFKCCAVTTKGQFVGYGTANIQRDARLAESLVELAETRSLARALRFAGFGLESTGAVYGQVAGAFYRVDVVEGAEGMMTAVISGPRPNGPNIPA
jgi:hypothetical protein